ncbi:unnamed protein product [Brassica oleracea]
MAKSMCIVTLLMIFLLISTGIPYGKAQCEGVPSNSTSPDICRSSDVDFVCTTVCASKGYISGECDNNFVCNCYNCLA